MDDAAYSDDCVSPPSPRTSICLEGHELPPWWAQPVTLARVRLRLAAFDGAPWRQDSAFHVRVTEPLSHVCRWLGPSSVACQDNCSTTPCWKEARPIWGAPDLAVYLPPRGGCLEFPEFPAGIVRVQASMEWYVDAIAAAKALTGLVLFTRHRSLRACRLLHLLIGAATAMLVAGAWVGPMGALGLSLTTVLWAFPDMQAFLGTVAPYMVPSNAADWDAFLNRCNDEYVLPVGYIIAGGIMVLSSLFMAAGGRVAYSIFKPRQDAEGEVSFFIAPDGRRVDNVRGPSLAQKLLGCLLWVAGAAILLRSLHSDAASVALLVVACFEKRAMNAFEDHFLFAASREAGCYRLLVSEAMYDEIGAYYTKVELSKLQSHLNANPGAVQRVREDARPRLRRFMESGQHAMEDDLEMEEDEDDAKKACSCALL